MRVLVCGGHDFNDVDFVIPRIQKLHIKTPITTLINGKAKGVDSIAEQWADVMDVPVEPYPSDWKSYGKSAGMIKNSEMLKNGKPDLVYAFPGGTGTANMVEIAKKSGIKVIQHHYIYFKKEDIVYGFLSNFYERDQVSEDGTIYKTNEHFYQSEKTLDIKLQKWVINAPTANEAKKRGRKLESDGKIREDWHDGFYKIYAMTQGLEMKFPLGSELVDRLLHTTDNYIVEYAPWGDTFWGVNYNYVGENWLGRLLMLRRDALLKGNPNHLIV